MEVDFPVSELSLSFNDGLGHAKLSQYIARCFFLFKLITGYFFSHLTTNTSREQISLLNRKAAHLAHDISKILKSLRQENSLILAVQLHSKSSAFRK